MSPLEKKLDEQGSLSGEIGRSKSEIRRRKHLMKTQNELDTLGGMISTMRAQLMIALSALQDIRDGGIEGGRVHAVTTAEKAIKDIGNVGKEGDGSTLEERCQNNIQEGPLN